MNKFQSNPFINIKDNVQPTQIESQCPRCFKDGKTIMLLASIPLFREILLCSFSCEHCGERNSTVQFAGKLPDLGVQILFRCIKPEDLNREVIKSQFSQIFFDELQLELPSKKAEITTIQSLLKKTCQDLSAQQDYRKINNQDEFKRIQSFLILVEEYSQGKKFPITLKIKDPSGNSYIKNPYAPQFDKFVQTRYFRRTLDELKQMGYSIENAQEELIRQKQRQIQICGNKLNFSKPFQQKDLLKHESIAFEVPCEVCHLPGNMLSCMTSVPYFTDLVIMSFSCQYCGYHTTQTKNSGQIGENAIEIRLDVNTELDLKRDLFKSETCYVNIPELQLQLDYGTLGGVMTTVQGLIEKILYHLQENNPFSDSDQQYGARMKTLLDDMAEMQKGNKKCTLILIDPLARSFIQNPHHPREDTNLHITFRERTHDQKENLGINDMKLQNYN